jgi:hypothetical protein
MADRLLALVHSLAICIGVIVALFGFAIFIDVRPGGKLMGSTGVLLGFALVVTAWVRITGLKRKKRADDLM